MREEPEKKWEGNVNFGPNQDEELAPRESIPTLPVSVIQPWLLLTGKETQSCTNFAVLCRPSRTPSCPHPSGFFSCFENKVSCGILG